MNTEFLGLLVTILTTEGLIVWTLATIKGNLEKQISSVQRELSEANFTSVDALEDLIKELEKKFEIYQALQSSERKAWKNEIARHFDKIRYELAEFNKKHKETRHDIYDIQQFLQNKLEFRIRSHRDTLNERPER